ncbi:MAG TPA: hypothetical protein VK327_00560 [Candidatus Paceibacterota bacterium]|nr:hypothetical protein [Candidatus Paceibacterota bacterium]
MKKHLILTVVVIIGICSANAVWNPDMATEDSVYTSAFLPAPDLAANPGGVGPLPTAIWPITPMSSTEFLFPANAKSVEDNGSPANHRLNDSQTYELVPHISAATRSFTFLAGALLLLPFALSMFRIAAKRRIAWPW